MIYKLTRTSLLGVFCLGAVMAPVYEGLADSSGGGLGPAILVDCKAVNSKVALPDFLCATFIQVVQQAYPGETVKVVSGDGPATLSLLTTQASAHSLTVQIGWGSFLGPKRAMTRMDKPLDAPGIATFLRETLEMTPRP